MKLFLNSTFNNALLKKGYKEIGKTGKHFRVDDKHRLSDQLFLCPGIKATTIVVAGGIF